MKVLYDFQTFFYQKFGGISKCFAELISHLPSDVDAVLGVKESDNVYLKELNLVPNLKPLHWNSEHFILPFYFKGQGKLLSICDKFEFLNTPYVVNKKYVIELLKKGDFDVFHPTYFDDYYLPYLGNKPFILTIHDMIPELFLDANHYQCRQKRLLAYKAAHIVAVSEHTKKDIMNILGIPAEKISVVYHAVNLSQIQKNASICNIDVPLPDKYFLYVGLRYDLKCFKQYLIHVASFFQKNKDVSLICTGKPFTSQELQLIMDLHLENQVFAFFLSTEQLMYAYSKAIAFIYPSRYEGFGIPILEAFAMQCPVLLNNASCFPEIAQDAACYFDIDDERSCLQAIEYIYDQTNEERNILIGKANERLKDFSWELSAKKLVDIYKNVVK